MSFFNVTQLGPQNPIKVLKTANENATGTKEETPPSTNRATPPHQHARPEDTFQIPSLNSMYNPNASSLPYKGSHKLFSEKRMKHQRHPKGPTDIYMYPMTTSQQYGWWMKYDARDWPKGEKHVHVNSEMTRFVDEMSATNKDFSLF
ncbi:PREDICTED: uncharacterized protein LOC109583659 [Amphimedon queenslandica]|uniref:Uncharacterized protein n=1 Tax=Amphimedon queenslandica TaxID=400682 RepID=A0AAN0JCD0_AMPQE|nr:PREDICTED: uncharacterized protein LOC109583659 [Amphimedon queenslandica]|eukprot:XP_019854654.1 PREDICTED: uncharacterized protein LOC109583659 [Amphimedon queenslandica]